MQLLPRELVVYVGRIREFDRADWAVYLFWVVGMVGLGVVIAAFQLFGRAHGAVFPAEAYLVPIGVAIFAAAIAVDTIGHRTIYKEALRGGEQLVHHVIIALGIASCVLLCLAYEHPRTYAIPAAVVTSLSFVYSLVDEAMHWRRYIKAKSDRVEMWSHVFILTGHSIMMLGWWRWFMLGYPGVAETLRAISA
ncbi:MAG: hypothetical protein ACAI38_18695 [Myxococcota bacterium]|nr:hypothetical protein [Myxococcota bacterium]